MSVLTQIVNNSISRKITMALTGLFLAMFMLEHLYGNLLLYANDNGLAFGEYSHTMVHSILIRIVEVALFGAIILHVIQAINLTRTNAAARPVKYAVNKQEGNSTWYSRNMGLTGSLILFFIVVHLYQFFVPYRIGDSIGGEGQASVAMAVKDAFHNPIYAGLYIISAVFLGFHLNHGFQSAFQTIGLNNKKYAPIIKSIGSGYAILLTIGFASFPILFFFDLVGSSIK